MQSSDHQLGIDVGGTGMKAAIVNTFTGQFVTEKYKMGTPEPKDPEAISGAIKQLMDHFEWQGPIGCGFPAIIRRGKTASAANINRAWLNFPAEEYISERVGQQCFLVNDADAAGIAEMAFGQGRGVDGTVILLTLGTGIGSGIFVDGKLVPNTEMGHLKWHNFEIAEHHVSNRARERHDLDWRTWGTALNEYLEHINFLFSPAMIILGGGVSKKFDLYEEYLTVDTVLKRASLMNNAGITGAAMHARTCLGH